MESAAIAAVAARAGARFVALRVVVDAAADELPADVERWIDERGERRIGAGAFRRAASEPVARTLDARAALSSGAAHARAACSDRSGRSLRLAGVGRAQRRGLRPTRVQSRRSNRRSPRARSRRDVALAQAHDRRAARSGVLVRLVCGPSSRREHRHDEHDVAQARLAAELQRVPRGVPLARPEPSDRDRRADAGARRCVRGEGARRAAPRARSLSLDLAARGGRVLRA